jgi:hypothetical protein
VATFSEALLGTNQNNTRRNNGQEINVLQNIGLQNNGLQNNALQNNGLQIMSGKIMGCKLMGCKIIQRLLTESNNSGNDPGSFLRSHAAQSGYSGAGQSCNSSLYNLFSVSGDGLNAAASNSSADGNSNGNCIGNGNADSSGNEMLMAISITVIIGIIPINLAMTISMEMLMAMVAMLMLMVAIANLSAGGKNNDSVKIINGARVGIEVRQAYEASNPVKVRLIGLAGLRFINLIRVYRDSAGTVLVALVLEGRLMTLWKKIRKVTMEKI